MFLALMNIHKKEDVPSNGIVPKLDVLSYRLYLLLTTTYSTPIETTTRWVVFDTMADLKSLMYLGIRIDQTPASPCNSTVWPTKFEMEGQHHHHRHFDTLMARVSQSFLFTPHS
jgi:hypothetical protein